MTDLEILQAANRLEHLAERWERTEVWHEPPFLDGRIHITTGDLKDIATLVRSIKEKPMRGKCPACGSDNTRCCPELTNDAIEHPEIIVECNACGNTGKATFDEPTDIMWDKEEPTDG